MVESKSTKHNENLSVTLQESEKCKKVAFCILRISQPCRVWCGPRVRGAATGRALGIIADDESQESFSGSSAWSGPRFTSRRRRSAALAIFISRPLGEGGESGAVRPPIAALVATSRTHPLPPRTAFCYRCVHSRVRHRPPLICIPAQQSVAQRPPTDTQRSRHSSIDPLKLNEKYMK